MSKAQQSKKANRRLGFFGHFGDINFGNESTLRAMLYHVRRYQPNAQLTCICTDPKAITRMYGIEAVSMNGASPKALWLGRNRVLSVLRKVTVGIPCELHRWHEAIRVLRRMDALIVPGTGLLTDLCGLRNWGPYNVFKWSVIAKICGCKLLFISVGAGPIHSWLGRWLVKIALACANNRSYRDHATKEYLESIGFSSSRDKIYPDLVYSLPNALMPNYKAPNRRRLVVGVGLMLYAENTNVNSQSKTISEAYLEEMGAFVNWLLAHDYDVRLVIGDICDRPIIEKFKALLKDSLGDYDRDRVIAEPVESVENLLFQLNETDAVVATRFHNVLLALILNKPVLSISFHQKCTSLMSDMGLGEYSQDIKHLDGKRLIEQFIDLQQNAAKLKVSIKQKIAVFRKALDEQYRILFSEVLSGGTGVPGKPEAEPQETHQELSVSGGIA